MEKNIFVYTEWHFVKVCVAYEDIRSQYKDNLQVGNVGGNYVK